MNIRKAMVLGMARSGIKAAELLLLRGAEVYVCDTKSREAFKGALDDMEARGAHLLLEEKHPETRLEGLDALIVSPGIRVEHPAIVKAKELGIEVMGEIEYAYREAQGLLLAITGTNGKTTTVTLTGEIFKNAGKRTHVVGNIGIPYTGAVPGMTADDVTVCEISSFMMETSKEFHPHCAAVLNISEDHMDRHHTMECYIGLKERVFEKCDANDFVVLNYDDPVTAEMAKHTAARVVWFSSRNAVPFGAFVVGENIVFGTPESNEVICPAKDLYIPGEHNLKNALAACALTKVCGVANDVIAETFRTFTGVEHRIEFVRELSGVRFINDSKGTNVDSTIQAVRAMDRPTVLILGGYDKHCDFSPLIEVILENPMIRHIVLIGATAQQLEDTLKKYNFTSYEHCGTDFEKTVRVCYERASEGWNVLFSPSCASFDMFSDYESRGRIFKDLANALTEK